MSPFQAFTIHPDELIQEDKKSVQNALSHDITEAIGRVPIVRVNRLAPVCQEQELYLKLESCNPGGSIKEKNAVFLIQNAEENGLLKEGGTIIESSSGNFGIGLAMVGAVKGYRVIIVVDAKTSPPMRRMLLAYGAELVDVPLTEADANGSMQVARMKKAAELAKQIPGAWYPCQHRNPLNPVAHTKYTAYEIDLAFKGELDAIVIGISTAGQLSGISQYFKERYPHIKLIGVDVAGSSILGTPVHAYKMTGLGLSFVPPNYNAKTLACGYSVPDDLAFSVCNSLAKKEGLLLGASTGAIVAAGLNYAMHCTKPQRILMINPDRGDRYLETVFNSEWLAKQGIQLSHGEELLRRIQDLPVVTTSILQGEKRAS